MAKYPYQPLSDNQSLNNLQSKIRANIKALRLSKGIKRNHLARDIGIHKQYLYMLEKGMKPINLSHIEKIAAYFKVDPASLLA